MQEAAGIFQPALELVAAYPYLMLFVGLLLVGELVLLPALYLAATGRLDYIVVLAVAITATMLSDFVWFLLGRWWPAAAVERARKRYSSRHIGRLEALFVANGARLLFLSKFVYGTRIAGQIIAGALRMPLKTWLLVNLAAVTGSTVVLIALAFGVADSSRRLEAVADRIGLTFLVFFVLVAGAYLLIGVLMRKRWFQSS